MFTFEDGLNGFVGAGQEIFQQQWVLITPAINSLKEIIDNGQFSETSKTFDEVKRSLEESSEKVENQGIFYTRANGESNSNGETMKSKILEAAEKVEEYKERTKTMDPNILKEAIIRYNDNLERAMIDNLIDLLIEACKKYNDERVVIGTEPEYRQDAFNNTTFGEVEPVQKSVYDRIDFVPLIKTWHTLAELEASELIAEIKKPPRCNYIHLDIPKRPEDTGREE